MFARIGVGVLIAASVSFSAVAGSMNADEAKRFVSGKVFSFTCFDGTRGSGRFFEDGGAAGAIQFSGSGPTRYMRLPVNTLQVRSGSVCASLKGLPIEPCFNLSKSDDRGFRGAVSGMGFMYCDFKHQGGASMLMARAHNRGRGPRSLAPEGVKQADAAPTEMVAKVETPRVEAAKIEPVKPPAVARVETSADASLNLRKSTD